MAQDAYNACLGLKEIGVDVELIINKSDFGMGLPFWEKSDLNMDPYNFNFDKALEEFPLPEWIHVWDNKNVPRFIAWSRLFKLIHGYDLLHLHGRSVLYLQFSGLPYIVHEAGLIRYITTQENVGMRLAKRSYKKSNAVIWTNPDTKFMVEKIVPLKLMRFIPFSIDHAYYKPSEKQDNNDKLLFFSPARQVWEEKGNDKLISAFAHFIKEGNDAKLILVDWGYKEDVQASKELAYRYDIAEHIEWIFPMSKPKLIKLYNHVDAVFDQFMLGSTGTAGLEAMSCGVPLCIYLGDLHTQMYGEKAPVENAYTPSQILESMKRLKNDVYKKHLGLSGRNYVIKHCDPKKIAYQMKNVYEEVLND